MMLPQTTKQMMQQSIAFRLSFGAAIGFIIGIIILSITLAFVSCSYYRSCSDQYGYNYSYSCYKSNYGPYCCNYNYYTCGDSYCYYDFGYYTSSRPCVGILITMWVFSALSFIFTIITFIMFCNFRSRAKLQNLNQVRANYAAMAYPNNSANQIVIS